MPHMPTRTMLPLISSIMLAFGIVTTLPPGDAFAQSTGPGKLSPSAEAAPETFSEALNLASRTLNTLETALTMNAIDGAVQDAVIAIAQKAYGRLGKWQSDYPPGHPLVKAIERQRALIRGYILNVAARSPQPDQPFPPTAGKGGKGAASGSGSGGNGSSSGVGGGKGKPVAETRETRLQRLQQHVQNLETSINQDKERVTQVREELNEHYQLQADIKHNISVSKVDGQPPEHPVTKDPTTIEELNNLTKENDQKIERTKKELERAEYLLWTDAQKLNDTVEEMNLLNKQKEAEQQKPKQAEPQKPKTVEKPPARTQSTSKRADRPQGSTARRGRYYEAGDDDDYELTTWMPMWEQSTGRPEARDGGGGH